MPRVMGSLANHVWIQVEDGAFTCRYCRTEMRCVHGPDGLLTAHIYAGTFRMVDVMLMLRGENPGALVVGEEGR